MAWEGAEGVIGRRMVFCETLQQFDTDELIKTCQCCDDFFLYCCSCAQNGNEDDWGKCCHHYRLIFSDGACKDNGQPGATAGIGLACGKDESDQSSHPITEQMDIGQKRTSQRAELLAAQFALHWMIEADRLNSKPREPPRKRRRQTTNTSPGSEAGKAWVIATDSEYVVKGMTEWFPKWKVSEDLTPLIVL